MTAPFRKTFQNGCIYIIPSSQFAILPEGVGNRYTLIDGFRGFAAAAVLLWHYQHFFMAPDRALPVVASLSLPFRSALELGYTRGHLGVPIFWTISGFVFLTVYRSSRATTRDFIVNRFARLYPLHLVTLIVVALLQILAFHISGNWLIYGNNDALHFLEQLFYIGGSGEDASFNGPIWSVSVELAIYGVFWTFHHHLEMNGIFRSTTLALMSAVLFKTVGGNIALCGFYFFLGCTSAALHACASRRLRWMVIVAFFGLGLAMHNRFGDSEPLRNGLAGMAMALILGLADLESLAPEWLRRACSAIGDCSYGLYLWHIPVQLTLLLAFGASVSSMATQGWFLALFLTASLACAATGFILIERPSSAWIRSKAKKPDPIYAQL